MRQYRIFSTIACLYILLEAFLLLAQARHVSLYPPFKAVLSVAAGASYALVWFFVLWVFRFFRQGGFIPWIVALFGLLCLVDPAIDASHTPAQADALRNGDYYTWFRFAQYGFQLVLASAFLSVTAKPIRWRCRWTGLVLLLALTVPLILTPFWKTPVASRYMPYAPLLALLPVLILLTLFGKARRAKLAAAAVPGDLRSAARDSGPPPETKSVY